MGAVESLDHCCSDRSDEKTSKQFMGTWKTPTKTQKDLNRDYGNGALICLEPLKDLKLQKSIDAELAAVAKEVGHRFPNPIHSQQELIELLSGFRKRGYSFRGNDVKVCAKIWSLHHCSVISILKFRAWFQSEVQASENNLRVLLRGSRWVSALVKRVYSESEECKWDSVCEVINDLSHHLEEAPISHGSVQKIANEVFERNGKVNYILSARGKILIQDFEAVFVELLVQLYCRHFDASLDEEVASKKKAQKFNEQTFLGASACCLPTGQSGLDTWRRVSESLPIGAQIPKAKSGADSARCHTISEGLAARSLKFPVGAVAA